MPLLLSWVGDRRHEQAGHAGRTRGIVRTLAAIRLFQRKQTRQRGSEVHLPLVTEGEEMRRLIAGVSVVLSLGTVAPALAGSLATHETLDATGSVVICHGTELTAAGSFEITRHVGSAASGNKSSTGTIVSHVTFADEDGNAYRLVGALRFGAAFNARQGTHVLVHVEHFVVLNAGGGPLGKISLTAHSSPNGKEFSLDLGSCD